KEIATIGVGLYPLSLALPSTYFCLHRKQNHEELRGSIEHKIHDVMLGYTPWRDSGWYYGGPVNYSSSYPSQLSTNPPDGKAASSQDSKTPLRHSHHFRKISPSKAVPHKHRHRRLSDNSEKVSTSFWQTGEGLHQYVEKTVVNVKEEKRLRELEDTEKRIQTFQSLQKPTHIRVWDNTGRSFLKPVRERLDGNGSSKHAAKGSSKHSDGEESDASVETV
ncbi:hypothetical protein BKA67DRAFT_305082, partial [Truncatella angustata]